MRNEYHENHENPPGTMENHEKQPGTMKNNEKQPGTMKINLVKVLIFR